MSASKNAQKVELVDQYHQVGIKAVAAASLMANNQNDAEKKKKRAKWEAAASAK